MVSVPGCKSPPWAVLYLSDVRTKYLFSFSFIELYGAMTPQILQMRQREIKGFMVSQLQDSEVKSGQEWNFDLFFQSLHSFPFDLLLLITIIPLIHDLCESPGAKETKRWNTN